MATANWKVGGGQIKVTWACTLTIHFLVIGSLSFAELHILLGSDVPPGKLNSLLTKFIVRET